MMQALNWLLFSCDIFVPISHLKSATLAYTSSLIQTIQYIYIRPLERRMKLVCHYYLFIVYDSTRKNIYKWAGRCGRIFHHPHLMEC